MKVVNSEFIRKRTVVLSIIKSYGSKIDEIQNLLLRMYILLVQYNLVLQQISSNESFDKDLVYMS